MVKAELRGFWASIFVNKLILGKIIFSDEYNGDNSTVM